MRVNCTFLVKLQRCSFWHFFEEGWFLKILSFEKGISAQQAMLWAQRLRRITPWSKNYEYFRVLPSYRGSYVLMGERQGKNKFSQVTSSKYCCFKKTGASIHLLPVAKQINTQKSGPGCRFKITTLILNPQMKNRNSFLLKNESFWSCQFFFCSIGGHLPLQIAVFWFFRPQNQTFLKKYPYKRF